MASVTIPQSRSTSGISQKTRQRLNVVFMTALTAFILFIFLLPLGYGIMTSLKTDTQISTAGSPWYPASPIVVEYEGKEYDVYEVPVDGEIFTWALVNKGREAS